MALLAGGLNSLQNRFIKVFSVVESTMVASIKSMTAAFLLGMVLLVFCAQGFVPTELTFMLVTVILASIVLETILYLTLVQALNLADQSVAGPLMGMSIVFSIPMSMYWLGEILSNQSLYGIILVFIGGIIIGWTGVEKIWERNDMRQTKGIVLMLVVAFGAALYISLTRFAYTKLHITPYELAFYVTLGLTISYSVTAFVRAKRKGSTIGDRKKVVMFGALFSLNNILHYIGIAFLLAPLFISIKRSSLGFDVLIGCLIGKEPHFAQRLTGALILFLGIGLIALG